ncbi:alpha/beta hydrolase family protein [Streptomyces himalayensis]|uniref:Alpha/beta fold hydrolase n=1 Tax=Streptomyces himalayensis subsp. himalayensis TaxID=2756131 RepID=A0A7W0DHS6_9ACTN|nr:alpha/beta hydrolase [Streptomyces himalayensis]MBA2944923.1 alpha/beta fold hydrolase [Streptomyces himalayensis subsp. himalayensis]
MELVIDAHGAELPATLTLPDGPARGGLIPLHGSHCGNRDFVLYEHLAEVLPAHGIAVLRYDRRPSPLGVDVPFVDQAADARAAISVLRRHIGDAAIGLWGFSQGGWVAPLAAATWPDEVAFLTLVSPSGVSPGAQMRYGLAQQLRINGFADCLDELSRFQDAMAAYLRGQSDAETMREEFAKAASQPWWPLLGYDFSDDVFNAPPGELWVDMDADLTSSYEAVRCPVLTFHGETDQWLSIDESIGIWREASAKSGRLAPEVIRLPGCDHVPTIRTGDTTGISPNYEKALLDWLNRPELLG